MERKRLEGRPHGCTRDWCATCGILIEQHARTMLCCAAEPKCPGATIRSQKYGKPSAATSSKKGSGVPARRLQECLTSTSEELQGSPSAPGRSGHSRVHHHANERQVAGEGVAAKKSWEAQRDSSHRSQGRWEQNAIHEFVRLARLKGSSPREASVATASLARWRRWVSVVHLPRWVCHSRRRSIGPSGPPSSASARS